MSQGSARRVPARVKTWPRLEHRQKWLEMFIQEERRQARSDNPLVALTRLLEAVRQSAALEALAVGDELGLLMAGAGAAELCDELAAVAPLFSSATHTCLPAELALLGRGTEVRRVAIEGTELFLSGRGGNVGPALSSVALGCARILVEKRPRLSH